MRGTVTNIEKSLEEFTEETNKTILTSINKKGLVPLHKLPRTLPINSIFGSHITQQCICVNHLSLEELKEEQVDTALDVAIEEEYTGIFGISLERAWPLEQVTNPKKVAEQIFQRLNANIVFVLKPPQAKLKQPQCVVTKAAQDKLVNRKHLTANEYAKLQVVTKGYHAVDTFTQIREQHILSGKNTDSKAVTEIKTHYSFTPEDVLFVLVPTELLEIARQTLTVYQDRIIEVKPTDNLVNIYKIPAVLTNIHGHAIPPNMISSRPPNYKEAIKKHVLPNHKSFSLHAVRMNVNPYDAEVRYIENLKESKELIKQTSAKVVSPTPGTNGGWALVHKSKTKKSQRELLKQTLPTRLRQSGRDESKSRTQLLQAKGNHKMVRIKNWKPLSQQPLSNNQCRALHHEKISGVYFDGQYFFSYATQKQKELLCHTDKLEQLGTELKEQEQQKEDKHKYNAATTLQSLFRGWHTRKSYAKFQETRKDLSVSKKNLSDAQKLFDDAKEQLDQAQQALEANKDELEESRLKLGLN